MRVPEVVRFDENIVDVSVAMNDDLDIDIGFAGQYGYLFGRLTGAKSAHDRRYNRLRNDASISDLWQTVPLPRDGPQTIPVFFMDGKRGFTMISEVISLREEAG